jgi:hypothetical protein
MSTMDTTVGLISWTDISQPHIPPFSTLSPMPAALGQAVGRLESAVGRRDGSSKRVAPSAGACYPYEILVAPIGEPVFGVVDFARRRVLTRTADRASWTGRTFVYFLVGRPWLAVRKYGRRGFFYHLLDAGHALLNLSLTAADLIPGTRPGPGVIAQAKREAAAGAGSVLAVGLLEAGDSGPGSSGWILQETTGASVNAPLSDIEEMMHSVLPPAPEPVHVRLNPDPGAAGLVRGLPRRHSAAALEAMPTAGGLVDALHEVRRLCERLIPSFGLPVPGIRVFSRHPGLGDALPDARWVTRALIGQTDLADASTFVVIHARVPDRTAAVLSSAAQRAVIAGGIAGEIGYLVASGAGIGITGVGGFDPERWARLCGTDDDVLFLLAIGREDTGEKSDVTSPDGRHG